MIKICANPHCGKEFEQTHNTQKYCCDKCAKYMHKHSHDIEKMENSSHPLVCEFSSPYFI